VSSGDLNLSDGGRPHSAQPDQAPPAGDAPCGPLGPDAIQWDWPTDVERFPEDAPLQALLLTATKLMGAYGQCTVQAAGLKVSLAGLGVVASTPGGTFSASVILAPGGRDGQGGGRHRSRFHATPQYQRPRCPLHPKGPHM